MLTVFLSLILPLCAFKKVPNKIISYILHVNVMAAEPGCQEQFYNLIIIMLIISKENNHVFSLNHCIFFSVKVG